MAMMREIFCPVCNETKREARATGDYSLECRECKIEAARKKEREWKAGREGLTVEERLRDIEHFMYHHGTHYKGPMTF